MEGFTICRKGRLGFVVMPCKPSRINSELNGAYSEIGSDLHLCSRGRTIGVSHWLCKEKHRDLHPEVVVLWPQMGDLKRDWSWWHLASAEQRWLVFGLSSYVCALSWLFFSSVEAFCPEGTFPSGSANMLRRREEKCCWFKAFHVLSSCSGISCVTMTGRGPWVPPCFLWACCLDRSSQDSSQTSKVYAPEPLVFDVFCKHFFMWGLVRVFSVTTDMS